MSHVTGSSLQMSSTNSSSSYSSQDTLNGVMREDLGSQTWEFPTDVFVRMLSPMNPRNPDNPEANIYLEDFDCYTDTEAFCDAYERAKGPFLSDYVGPGSASWIKDKKDVEKSSPEDYYEPMRDFLNQTIASCRDALDNKTEFLSQNSSFAYSSERDMTGVASVSGNLKLVLVLEGSNDWLVKPKDESTLVCELKDDWPDLVSQLATYARCQFDAYPSRLFVLTIGFNHKTNEARFMIFHRSGLTASPALVLTKKDARLDFLKIFMTVMNWKEGRDAGFSDSNDNYTYNLGNETWNITGKLHHTSCVRGRATIVNILELDTSGSPDLSTVTVVPQSESVIGRKRKSTEGDGKPSKSTKRRTGGGPSRSGFLATIAEDLKETSDEKIACFPIKARGHPDYYLQADHPEDSADGKVSKIVMKECHAIKGRTNVEGESLGYKGNKFGVANIRATYKACYSSGQLQSTAIYLPKDEDAKKHHWQVFAAFNTLPEPRTCVLIEMTSLGSSFLKLKHKKDLLTCAAHSMLGWLNVYQHGFLHRDISIGNILAFEKPEEREPFRLTDDFKASLGKVTMQMLDDKLRDLGLEQSKDILIPDAASWATKLEQLLETHNIGTSCVAFIIDGDLAKNWKHLFEHWSEEKELTKRERSGTTLFMSHNLLRDNEIKGYIQSPTDDIESFLWVTLYAMINNPEFRSELHQTSAENFESGYRDDASSRIRTAERGKGLFSKWDSVTVDLSGGYMYLVEKFSLIAGVNGWKSVEEEARYWKAAWHGYALEGVCRTLEVIFEHVAKM